jgi:bifunctional UDP-N-acetylglucosamine pyrophosphorylase / glucosamine-1-phosphate N-acetyltransferase
MKAIVLAGGKGTRLNSAEEHIPKVLRRLNDRCIIDYCLQSIDIIEKKDTYVVIGFEGDRVREYLGQEYNYCLQKKQLGTAHAVLCSEKFLAETDEDAIIIYGDMPNIKKDTIKKLVEKHTTSNSDLTILTVVVESPLPYGRVLRNKNDKIFDIIEEKDANTSTKNIKELNVGVIVVKLKYLYEGLKKIKNNNFTGEYYLTGLTKVFYEMGKNIEGFSIYDEDEIRGINTKEDLIFSEKHLNSNK